jgi:putative transposase
VPEREEYLQLMHLPDEQDTRCLLYGTGPITAWLRTQGHMVNHIRVERLMSIMGLEVITPKPRLSVSEEQPRPFPFLVGYLSLKRLNQVWNTDITCIRLYSERGFHWKENILCLNTQLSIGALKMLKQ